MLYIKYIESRYLFLNKLDYSITLWKFILLEASIAWTLCVLSGLYSILHFLLIFRVTLSLHAFFAFKETNIIILHHNIASHHLIGLLFHRNLNIVHIFFLWPKKNNKQTNFFIVSESWKQTDRN